MFSNLSINEQYSYLIKCSNAYYETGNSIISDETFDKYVQEYEKNSGKQFKYLGKSNNKKITLPVWMGSLDKVKSEDRLKNFMQKYTTTDLIYSEKLDGCSILLFKDKSGVLRLSTRGDGQFGSDITHLIPHLKLGTIKNDLIVRGEIIMRKDIFNTHFAKDFPNARNLVSGIINSKTIDTVALSKCDIVAYSLPNSKFSPAETFNLLHQLGFQTPINGIIPKENISIQYLSLLLDKCKKASKYEIDGLVIADNSFHSEIKGEDPKYTIAFKKNAEGVQATVVDVLWEETRYGLLKPRVQIKPIDVGGVTITYLSGFHAQFINENKIGPNTIITICRSGDVIPHIMNIVKPTEPKFPNCEYEWTESVDIRVKVKSTNTAQQIAHFFTVCGSKGLKEATIQKCIDCGLTTIESIMNANSDQLCKAEGIQTKSADKIIEQCMLAKSNCTLTNIMEGSCIFEGFGNKKLQKIITTLSNSSTINIFDVVMKDYKYNESTWESSLNNAGIKTQASTFLIQFKQFLNDWKVFCKKYCKIENINNNSNNNSNNIINNKCNFIVVFTGVRDNDLKNTLESIGAKVVDSISKSTTHLIVKDKNTTSSKAVKAKENGVIICTIDEMKEIIKTL
jgi:NAD-dependent DNA ligase